MKAIFRRASSRFWPITPSKPSPPFYDAGLQLTIKSLFSWE
jgi:hypothetical protein